jgi:tetratricopeptide (TPR) repeat protein
MSSKTGLIRVLRNNIKQALRHRQLDEAAKLLDRLKQEDPLAGETRCFELEYLLALKRSADALVLAEQLLQLFPGSGLVQFLAGRCYYQRKDYAKAAECFSESFRIAPRWDSQRWLGKTYTQTGRFDDAESLLNELASRYHVVNLDLAWLYERRGNIERAIGCMDAYLEKHPGAEYAIAKRKRLFANAQDPETLKADVDMLVELDEEIPSELLEAYIKGLLETGESRTARRFILERLDTFDDRTATSLGWICYHRQAFDLAMALFLKVLPSKLSEGKFLSTLETTARRCNRIEDLLASYETYAPLSKNLYGRSNRLRAWLEGGRSNSGGGIK